LNSRQPLTRPMKVAGIRDRDEPEVPFRKPLPEECEGRIVRLGRSAAENHP